MPVCKEDVHPSAQYFPELPSVAAHNICVACRHGNHGSRGMRQVDYLRQNDKMVSLAIQETALCAARHHVGTSLDLR